MKIVTAAQMQALDRRTIDESKVSGLTLMERAGSAVAKVIEQRYHPLRGRAIAVICGKGNNGGDGFVVARLLRARGAAVTTLLLGKPETLSPDAQAMYQRLVRGAGRSHVLACTNRNSLTETLAKPSLIVDAVFGTGLTKPIMGLYRDAIEAINEMSATRHVPVIAVDMPSGIHADTGEIMGAAVGATATVTFGLPKVGLYVGPGIDHAGDITVADIGIPQAYVDATATNRSLITADMAAAALPERRTSSHKGSFGHAGIIAGSPGKTGAAAMAAKAALRVGTGLVTVATPAGAHLALESKTLEAMTMPMPETDAHTLSVSATEPLLAFAAERSAVAIGPGLTTHPETIELVRRLIPRIDAPLVLDADALNALAGHADVLSRCKIMPIVTPHPGEMARLTGKTAQAVNADRLGTAAKFATAYRAITVLKGARTVIAHPDGRLAISPTGNPGMATGGTGDVLTGMVAGFLAQRIPGWDAACTAVYLHGLAGDLAAEQIGQIGLTAGDVIGHIPHAIQTVLAQR